MNLPLHTPARPGRLPPYGRALFEARSRGRHPQFVRLMWGRDWRDPTPWLESPPQDAPPFLWQPRLALDPLQFEPGTLDWRLLAGCAVDIHDREYGERRTVNGAWALAWLAGEMACWAREVVIRWEDDFLMAEHWAFVERRWDPDRRAMVWPTWWPERLRDGRAAH